MSAKYKANPTNASRVGQKINFMVCNMEITGVKFDVALGEHTLSYCKRYMRRLEAALKPQLPKVPSLASSIKPLPKTRFRNCKAGVEPSANLRSWVKEYDQSLVLSDGEWLLNLTPLKSISTTEPYLPVNYVMEHEIDLYSGSDMLSLKNIWMRDFGWKPTLWNVKKDEKGKAHNTTPKLQEHGNVCESLLALAEVPYIKMITRWVALKHRRGMLETKSREGGFLHNDRVKKEGRISGRMAGLTHTRRWRHAGVVNIPKPSVFLGDRLRSLFTCDTETQSFVNYDASSGEAMMKAHWAYPYDDGDYARRITAPDYDEHSESGALWFPDMGARAGRTRAKNGNYALQYECQPPTLSKQLGCSLPEAQGYYDKYWGLNYGWRGALDEWNRQWVSENGKKYLFNTLTGVILQTRAKHTLGSTMAQHSLAFTMDYSLLLMDHWLGGVVWEDGRPCYRYKGHKAELCLYVHDEASWVCDKEIAEDILRLGKMSITTAGEHLGLRVPLGADGKIGTSWGDTH